MKHGGKALEFSKTLLDSMSNKSDRQSVNVSNISQNGTKAYIVMNTGSNGMEVRELKVRRVLASSGNKDVMARL